MVPKYNRIDAENDTKNVIEAKIDAIKESYANGEITFEDMEGERAKLERATERLGYSFTW